MTYEQAIEKIHSLLTFGSRPGLDRMRIFLEKLGNPQDKLKYIHIAGTNGKGSVCAMLSAVLVEAGYKTGLFISPYITTVRGFRKRSFPRSGPAFIRLEKNGKTALLRLGSASTSSKTS